MAAKTWQDFRPAIKEAEAKLDLACKGLLNHTRGFNSARLARLDQVALGETLDALKNLIATWASLTNWLLSKSLAARTNFDGDDEKILSMASVNFTKLLFVQMMVNHRLGYSALMRDPFIMLRGLTKRGEAHDATISM